MMMANLLPRCSLPMASRMKGNFWMVAMTIFLPSRSRVLRCPGSLGVAHDRTHLRELPDSIPNLPVQNPPVGDHDY